MISSQNYLSKQNCSCDQSNLHLHVEIENLKQRLLERERHIVKMETNFLKESDKFPNGEFAALAEELLTWQDKYSRLFEAHKRVQKVNQSLEDKLLKIVDKCETEKNNLQTDITSLTKKLMEQQRSISKLYDENERYRNDLNIAIQLLQCKPSNFVPQKFDMLPFELQAKVRSYVASKQRKYIDGNGNTQKPEVKMIKVPIPTFPPTAMVYSLDSDREQNNDDSSNKQTEQVDIVSAAIMAKILKEREKERLTAKHCQSCNCSVFSYDSKSCQTDAAMYQSSDNRKNKNFIEPSSDDTASTKNDCSDKLISESKCKTESKDLIDLNGYNSDDNYKCFKTIRPTNYANKDDSNKDLISFDSSTTSSESFKGPRLCSVRVQPGSNNILLDNAAQFSSPILYKRRQSNGDKPDAPVHSSKHRTSSISSYHAERSVSTETEI